jgi:long-chain acyl-CoA synthetase
MQTELDQRILTTYAKLTAPDGPMATTKVAVNGRDYPMITTAPPALPQYLAGACMMHAEKEFIVSGDERLTFVQTYAVARKVAGALVADHGVKRGDRVGIAMRNTPSWIVLYMATLMAGAGAVLLNGWWQGEELKAGVEDVDATLILADAERARRLSAAGYDGPAKVLVIDVALPIDDAISSILVGAGGTDTALPEMGAEDLATILFTSGSTGRSKGAFSNHRAVVQGTYNYIALALLQLSIATEDGKISETPPQPSLLLSVPLFHVTGEVPMLLVSFALGRKLVMMPKWDAVQAMQLIEKERITSFTGVPLMSFEITSHPDRKKYDLSSLQGMAGGGAPRPVEHVKRIADELPNAPPAIGYGLTETNGVGCGNMSTNYIAKPTSTGTAQLPLVEIGILDDAGNNLPKGQKGEVAIRSIANFSGYWNRPDATAAAIMPDGWFRTGDIGYLDPEDYLFIVDRKKDIIIRGGENISCQEVEAALYENPAVAEACVFGLPDERLGEVPGAVVHLHPGSAVSEADLQMTVKERLAAFNVPERIWIEAHPLPRLGTEKLDKVGLRARFQAEWAQK